jgi:tetratricopeptide (TPR) repeat protein
VKGLSVEQIAARLDDRFRLLTGGSRTALPRRRTLQAAIDWSYRLLSEEERLLLRRLSVFADGWTIEAAEQVCASDELDSSQILDLLLTLVDKSLVVAKTQEIDPRYHLLETIRQYAQEKLDESGEANLVRDCHLEYFRSLAEQARPHFQDAEQFTWLESFETELDNVRAALTWSLQGGSVEAGLGLAADLAADVGGFWFYQGHVKEGHEFLEQLLGKAQSTDQMNVLASGYFASAALVWWLGDITTAYQHTKQSESLWLQLGQAYKVKATVARFLKVLGYKVLNPDYDPILVHKEHQEILQIFQETGDRWSIAHALFEIANETLSREHLREGEQGMKQSLLLFHESGDQILASVNSFSLAMIAIKEGRYVEARKFCEEALPAYRQLPFQLKDMPLWLLGAISVIEGDYAAAKAWYTECLLFDQKIGFYLQFPECLIGFASIASFEKRFERAAQLIGQAETALEARGDPLEDFDQAELQRLQTSLCEELGDTQFEILAAEGRAMSQEQAIRFALEELE